MTMKPRQLTACILSLSIMLSTANYAVAADPTATNYTYDNCEGSLTPYRSSVDMVTYPDSLVPVFINHVGRHGSRYPASSANCLALRSLLQQADSAHTITSLGRRLQALNEQIIGLSNNMWGALDSVGVAEQQALASRMFVNFAEVFRNGAVVQAVSSYSPRSMMSMYAFTAQIDRLNNKLTFKTSTGRINSPLVRPFDSDTAYASYRRAKAWEPAYKSQLDTKCPLSAVKRVLGEDFPFADDEQARNAALTEYYVIAGLRAMGLPSAMSEYFTLPEANALWSCFNLRQYLQRAASTVSTAPADIAAALVQDLIDTTDDFVSGRDTETTLWLRFGHAETLMPLLSLLRIPGSYYLTNYFDTVARHWCDFAVVPMSANFRIVLFKAKASGNYYVRVDVNETPVALRRGSDDTIYPWGELRRYMEDCIPLNADSL